MTKQALLIIDLQKVSYRGESAIQMDAAVEYIQAALPLFRAQKLPIVWIQQMEEEDGTVPGTEPFELIAPLEPVEGDYHIVKTYSNSFNKTDLHDILQREGVDTVIISGYCAEYCVTATLFGAEDRDYNHPLSRRHRQRLQREPTGCGEGLCCHQLRSAEGVAKIAGAHGFTGAAASTA